MIGNKKGMSFWWMWVLVVIVSGCVFFMSSQSFAGVEDKRLELTKTQDIIWASEEIRRYEAEDIISREVGSSIEKQVWTTLARVELDRTEKNGQYDSCIIGEGTDRRAILYNAILPEDKRVCMPELSASFTKDTLDTMKRNLDVSFAASPLFSDKEISTEVILTGSASSYEVEVVGKYNKESSLKNYKVTQSYYKKSFDYSSFASAVNKLREILPQLNTKLLSCKDDTDTCVKSILNEELKDTGYTVEISRSTKYSINNYIFYDMKLKKGDETNMFGFIIEDKKPLGSVSFELYNYLKADNVVGVRIFDNGLKDVKQYIAIYSYDDFFDSSYTGYDNLITRLTNNFNPGQPSFGGATYGSTQYYYAPEDTGMQLSFAVIPSSSFKEVKDNNQETKQGIETLKINQIYNYEKKEYELLDINKPVYVYVFAISEQYIYLLDKENLDAKSIATQKYFGPLPLATIDSVRTDILGYNAAITFRLDPSRKDVDHYDVYVLDGIGSKELKRGCLGVGEDYRCYYFDGTGKLTPENLGKAVMISADSSVQALSESQGYLFISNFVTSGGPFVLNSGSKYDLIVIPVDKDGGMILKSNIQEDVFTRSTSFPFYTSDTVTLQINAQRDLLLQNLKDTPTNP